MTLKLNHDYKSSKVHNTKYVETKPDQFKVLWSTGRRVLSNRSPRQNYRPTRESMLQNHIWSITYDYNSTTKINTIEYEILPNRFNH